MKDGEIKISLPLTF